MLNIKLPHKDKVDNLIVKVNNGVEANILPLDSFRYMFPHTLDKDGYPVEGFLKGPRTNLECYYNGRLRNHGSIKLRLQHYSNKSFQDHCFYIVEMKIHKEIIVRHPESIRLGLIQVLCKNITKSIAAIETSSKNSFQHCELNIDGKILHGKQRSKSESNRDHSSSSSKRQAERLKDSSQ